MVFKITRNVGLDNGWKKTDQYKISLFFETKNGVSLRPTWVSVRLWHDRLNKLCKYALWYKNLYSAKYTLSNPSNVTKLDRGPDRIICYYCTLLSNHSPFLHVSFSMINIRDYNNYYTYIVKYKVVLAYFLNLSLNFII